MNAIARALHIAAKQTNTAPSDAQKEAGNYAKGRLRLHGMDIAIENPKGGERSGVGKDGKRWAVKMPAHYGYVKGTKGKDDDAVDVYVGPKPDSGKVYIVDQVEVENGKFDEHKAMLGYTSKNEALADYRKAFSDGKAKDRIGAVTEMTVDQFRDWTKSGKTKQPLGLGKGDEAMAGDKSSAISRALGVARRYAQGGKVGDGGVTYSTTTTTHQVTLPNGHTLTSSDPRGFADGGTANDDPFSQSAIRDSRSFEPSSWDTGDIGREMAYRSAVDRPLGLPEYLAKGIRDVQLQEGPHEDDGRPRGMPGPLKALYETGELGAEMTGIPNLVRGYGNVREGASKGDWTQGLAGAGQMALGAIPGMGAAGVGSKALSTLADAPWKAGLTGGALGLPGAVLGAREAHAASLQEDVARKLAGMSPSDLRAYQAMIGVAADGKIGPTTISKAMEYQAKLAASADADRAAADRKAAADAAIAMERAKAQGATELEVARIKADAKAKADQVKADRDAQAEAAAKRRDEAQKLPIRELMADYMPYLPVAVGAIAGMSGSAVKSAYAKAYNKSLDDLVPRWETAVKARDPALAGALGDKINAMRAAGPGGTMPALGVGAGEGFLVGMAPEEIDLARGIPHAWETLRDEAPTVAKRAALAIATGATAAGLGGIKSAASARKSENMKDFSPETDVMRGVKQSDITTAQNLAAYYEAQQAARARAGLAESRANRDLGVGDATSRLATRQAGEALQSDAADAALSGQAEREVHRRLSGPTTDLGKTEVLPPLSPLRPGEASSSQPALAPPPVKVFPGTNDPLPAGMDINSAGLVYNIHTGHIVKTQLYKPKANGSITGDEGKASGGAVGKALHIARKFATGGKVTIGPVVGATGGRTDALPVSVPSGAFVIPADIVSGLGEGNSLNGVHKLEATFGKAKASGGHPIPIKISDGEFVVTPEQVAKLGGGDIDRGHRILDAMVLKVRKQHIQTLAALPPPSK